MKANHFESILTMKRKWIVILAAIMIGCISSQFAETHILIDLREIGSIAPKGRVQDKEYNPSLPIIDQLIMLGPKTIPFLVSKLEDRTLIKEHVMDFWPQVRVGDVAWFILCDFFTTADWRISTISPGFGSIIENRGSSSSWIAWWAQIKKDGRVGIRKKVERILRPYKNNFYWDSKELCFRPIK